MEVAARLKRGISRQLSMGSLRKSGRFSLNRQSSLDPKRAMRFKFGRQSSLDPNRGSDPSMEGKEALKVPENLDATMNLLFLSCKGDVKGVEGLLMDGVDVDSIDLDGRTALHIAACEGHVDVVKLLLRWRANIDARDRWGSTAAADAKYYGNSEIYKILKARGAKVPETRKTPMVVSNPHEVPEYELNPSEVHLRRCDGISRGVYQVAKWNGTKVAVKILDKDCYTDPDKIVALKNELMLLQRVRHPNVVQFVGAVTQNLPMMIVLEYPSKGDLGSYLQKKGRLKLSKALRLALEIARGMNYLHQCKPEPIIHCDLKPKNILLDGGGQLKVAGCGSIKTSKILPDKVQLDLPTQIDSSNLYMAPEVHKGETFNRSVDSFSFGLILYEMIEGTPPFHPNSPEDATKMISLEGKRPTFKHKSKTFPRDVRDLIEECWDPKPVVRPTFFEILVRLDKMAAHFSKQGGWKDTFKIPWK